MQPTKTRLENFLSYGNVEIDMSDIQLAALLGHNGAGKSSLLDSITFGLYGEGRYKNIDDYIRQGQEQAIVEQEFLLNGDHYRVIRGRSNKGRGKSTLEFAKINGESWVPLPREGASIRETEQYIRDVLRMDYDTFVSSCFILQGQSDKFCAAGPAERKKILAQILGLDIYDRLEAATKEKVKILREKAAITESRIGELEKDLSIREGLISEKKDAEFNIENVAQKIKELETALEAKEKERQELTLRVSKKDDLAKRDEYLQEEVKKIDELLEQFEVRKQSAVKKADLEDRLNSISAEIEFLEEKLGEAEKQLSDLKTKASRKKDLQESLEQVNRDINSIQKQINTYREKWDRLNKILERKDDILAKSAECDQAKKELSEIDLKATQERELQQKVTAAEKALSEWKHGHRREIDNLNSRLEQCEKKKAILEKVDCDRRDCLFLKDAFEASENFEVISKKLAKMTEQKPPEALNNVHQEHFEKLRSLGYNPEIHSNLRTQIQSLEKWAKLKPELDQAEENHKEIKGQVQELKAAMEEKQKTVSDIENKITDARKADTKSKELTSEVCRLKDDLNKAREVEQGIRTELGKAQAAEEQLRELEAQAEAKRGEREGKLSQIEDVRKELLLITEKLMPQLEELEKQYCEIRDDLSQEREEQQNIRVVIGRLEHRLAELDQKEEERKGLAKELKNTSRELYLHDALVKAFGKNGIPALIVENSLPDIEDLANDLLGRLTGSRMSVRLETQKEGKTTKTLSETLDILIGDELGERPYEGWSGAERFEVDISLRLAISKFLTRRAGTKIETLVIDEGASCLDQDGRVKFLEAINVISEDFAKIIVISHIDELKEAFPQQIHVTKSPEGSRVEVVA